jgi:cytochrome c oxidase cbb3-type subunit I/II
VSEPTQAHWHRRLIEGRSALFAILSTVAISVGTIAELVPLFNAKTGPEAMEGITPYTALEVAGRDIYVREGCYVCHSQMVRPFRAETLRYGGEWSRAGEYVYDRPFQLGSRRIGPDLHRVGGKWPDSWHYEHMVDPRSTSEGSIMPAYSWLAHNSVDPDDIVASMRAQQRAGTPYSEDDITGAPEAMKAQAQGIVERLKTAKIEAAPDREIIAIIAYLQRLGVEGRASIAKSQGGAK